MKDYAALLVYCSIILASCVKSEELRLNCAGEKSRDSNPPLEWQKEFVVNLTTAEVHGYNSEWHDTRPVAETSLFVEYDAPFVTIYDSLIDVDPIQLKVMVISTLTGEFVITNMPENRISVAGNCSGATGKNSDDS